MSQSLRMTSSAESVVARQQSTNVLALMLELSKPRITRMVVMTALVGALVAPGETDLALLLVALLATAFVVAGANALNMLIERDVDAKMERTRARPLPSGRTSPEFVLGFGMSAAALGLALMGVLVNPLAAGLAALALLTYTLVYTPLKQRTPYALHAGAVPGAIPPLIGYAAMAGRLDPIVAELALILLIWQLPHFMAIALFRLPEYRAAGLSVYPLARGEAATKRAIVLTSLLLAAITFLPVLRTGGGMLHAAALSVLNVGFLGLGLYGFWAQDTRTWARRLFLASIPFLVVVYTVSVVAAG